MFGFKPFSSLLTGNLRAGNNGYFCRIPVIHSYTANFTFIGWGLPKEERMSSAEASLFSETAGSRARIWTSENGGLRARCRRLFLQDTRYPFIHGEFHLYRLGLAER